MERVPALDVPVTVTPALVTLTQPPHDSIAARQVDYAIDVSGLFEVAAPGGPASASEMVSRKTCRPAYVSRQVLSGEPDPPLLERLYEFK